MNVRKMRQIAFAVVGVLALSAPAFAQEAAAAGGGLDLYDMFAQMGAHRLRPDRHVAAV